MNIYFKNNYIIAKLCDNKRFNLANVEQIQNCLTPIIQHTKIHLIFDMQNIHFIDCQAVTCLISLTELAEKNNSTFVLCNLSEHVQLLIDTLQLSSILHIEDNIKTQF